MSMLRPASGRKKKTYDPSVLEKLDPAMTWRRRKVARVDLLRKRAEERYELPVLQIILDSQPPSATVVLSLRLTKTPLDVP
jgi:hypothetical protein